MPQANQQRRGPAVLDAVPAPQRPHRFDTLPRQPRPVGGERGSDAAGQRRLGPADALRLVRVGGMPLANNARGDVAFDASNVKRLAAAADLFSDLLQIVAVNGDDVAAARPVSQPVAQNVGVDAEVGFGRAQQLGHRHAVAAFSELAVDRQQDTVLDHRRRQRQRIAAAPAIFHGPQVFAVADDRLAVAEPHPVTVPPILDVGGERDPAGPAGLVKQQIPHLHLPHRRPAGRRR